MTNQEKVNILNSMKVIDEDCGGGEIVYVLVEYSEENKEKLSKVVPDVDEYIKNCGDPDGNKEGICIAIAAFEYAKADYYYKGKFVIFTKDELIEMYEEEKSKRIKLEKELNRDIQEAGDLHLQTILELQRIKNLVHPIDDPVHRTVGVALSELEEKFHKIHDKWSEN